MGKTWTRMFIAALFIIPKNCKIIQMCVNRMDKWNNMQKRINNGYSTQGLFLQV